MITWTVRPGHNMMPGIPFMFPPVRRCLEDRLWSSPGQSNDPGRVVTGGSILSHKLSGNGRLFIWLTRQVHSHSSPPVPFPEARRDKVKEFTEGCYMFIRLDQLQIRGSPHAREIEYPIADYLSKGEKITPQNGLFRDIPVDPGM